MPPRTHALAVAGVAAVLALAACTRPSAPTATAAPTTKPSAGGTAAQEIVLNARDIAFAPSALSLRAGVPARLVFVNNGQIEHDVTIADIIGDGKTAEGHGHEETSHAMGQPAAGTVHVSAHAGDRPTVEFTPKAGTFEYACSLPGHKDAGMRGTLTVK